MPRPTTYPSTTEVFPNRVYGLVGHMKSLWGKCRSDLDDATNRPDHRRRSSSPTTPTTETASRVKDKRPYKKSQQFHKISHPPYHLLTMYFSRVFSVFALLAASADAFMGQPMGFASRPTAMMSRTSSSSLNMVADDAKVVLVTGSSRGLGKSIALDIGKAGQKVVINYVSDGSKGSAEEVVAEIKAAGGDAVAIQADSEYYDLYLSLYYHFLFWYWQNFDWNDLRLMFEFSFAAILFTISVGRFQARRNQEIVRWSRRSLWNRRRLGQQRWNYS